jgi:GTPase SAR1 family protein
MEQSPYPQELLQAPVSDRVRFFVHYTMAHPHLIKAFNEVMQSVYHAPGISLIFVVGATGVGKTTLLHRLEQKLTQKALPELKHNPGKVPVIGLEAKAPEFSQFDWKDFYIRLLKVLKEPLVEKKINYGQSCSKWRSAVESALINRSLDAFYIDEAHHLTMLPSGRKLKDQPETLKSLANLTKVKIIPTGTYDLLPLIDLGDQLCRRSKTIHFQRYHAENSQEAQYY